MLLRMSAEFYYMMRYGARRSSEYAREACRRARQRYGAVPPAAKRHAPRGQCR